MLFKRNLIRRVTIDNNFLKPKEEKNCENNKQYIKIKTDCEIPYSFMLETLYINNHSLIMIVIIVDLI